MLYIPKFKKKEKKKLVMGGIRTSSVRTIYSKFRCFGCLIRRRKFRRFWPKRAKRLLICTLRSVKHFKDAQIIAIGRIVCPQTQRNGPMREHGIAILCFLCLHPVGLLQPTEVMYSIKRLSYSCRIQSAVTFFYRLDVSIFLVGQFKSNAIDLIFPTACRSMV